MLVTALIALLIQPGSWTAIAFIELVVAYFVLQMFTTNLPTAIRRAMDRNCVRADGSYSSGRAAEERAAVGRLKNKVLFAVILVLIPTNALLWYVHHEGVPLSRPAVQTESEPQIRLVSREWSLILGGALWIVIALRIIASAYLHSLKELHSSIKIRAEQYRIHDLEARQIDPATTDQNPDRNAMHASHSVGRLLH